MKTVNPEREERLARRNLQKEFHVSVQREQEQEKKSLDFSLFVHSYCKDKEEEECFHVEDVMEDTDDVDTGVTLKRDIGCQCDPDPLILENQRLKLELRRIRDIRWSVTKIKDDDAMTRFYTGLPSFAVFLWLFNYLAPKLEKMVYWRGSSATPEERSRARRNMALEPINQFLATLMRLKVGLYVQDMAERFGASVGAFSQYFTTWICLLHKELKDLNPFPSRDVVQRNMPTCFKSFQNLRVILDCTEIFIQKSNSLINQNQSFSHYKHHTTLKFLIGITPSGVISFVSEGFGGKISDRQMIERLPLLDLLEERDVVMADKGFTIRDLLEKKGCSLNIPPFRSSSCQFSTVDVFNTQDIAKLRIHVERAIGRVKNFHIFDGVLSLSLVQLASQIFSVCCWLTNLDVPMVESNP
ncbi:uncharacterized protein LOC133182161 [Saccostrea echinata]|uniref:uncharacterized protein LOC133182161 n=1 Tax=Saccostrea echinata TaxID=191078 RepID=UPI002A80929D|nr:uncharacterized protein LOC133182161 [Saccostrea echinata]XP_061172880.1 uncharacterized protein LOC133182161 [Saccostrea echinata]